MFHLIKCRIQINMHLLLSFICTMPLEAEVLRTKILQTACAGIMSYDESLTCYSRICSHVSLIHRHLFIFCMENTFTCVHSALSRLRSTCCQGTHTTDSQFNLLLTRNPDPFQQGRSPQKSVCVLRDTC